MNLQWFSSIVESCDWTDSSKLQTLLEKYSISPLQQPLVLQKEQTSKFATSHQDRVLPTQEGISGVNPTPFPPDGLRLSRILMPSLVGLAAPHLFPGHYIWPATLDPQVEKKPCVWCQKLQVYSLPHLGNFCSPKHISWLHFSQRVSTVSSPKERHQELPGTECLDYSILSLLISVWAETCNLLRTVVLGSARSQFSSVVRQIRDLGTRNLVINK